MEDISELIEHQKEVALKLLHKLEGADPYAILAGGAPRDWYFNKPCNDLDFYVHLQYATIAFEELRMKRLGLEVTRLEFKGSLPEEYKCMEDLTRIYEGVYEGVNFQVMVMKTSTFKSVIPKFGASVCKAWWKGGEVCYDLDFIFSHVEKVIFKKDDYTAKEKHITKMQERYPDYKLIPYSSYNAYLDNFCNRYNIYNSEWHILTKLKEISNER